MLKALMTNVNSIQNMVSFSTDENLKNQMEVLEKKNIIREMENAFNRLLSRLDVCEERNLKKTLKTGQKKLLKLKQKENETLKKYPRNYGGI